MLQGKSRKIFMRKHRIIKKKYLELSDLQSCNNYVGGEVKWNKTRCMKSYKVGKLLNDLNDLYAKNNFEDIGQNVLFHCSLYGQMYSNATNIYLVC